jgi:1-deoxy-D-xylulose-5-phosphate reductoisomerase
MKKKIAILGSTGSIGQQTLEVIDAQKELFNVEVLTANRNASLLIQQAMKFQPNVVVIADESRYTEVADALQNEGIKVYAGTDAVAQVTGMESIDLVVMAILGFDALKPLLASLENKKPLALANKETLVAAGDLVMQAATKNRVPVIPVDSEHSAVFQCLMGEFDNPVEKVVLTASGGPFLGRDHETLSEITPEEALRHPNWKMGFKTTIDSASLMNKGLEAIEAQWLFGLNASQIEILIHPQSVIHSLVYFADGSVKALLADTDMHIPIQFAMSYPRRIENNYQRLDLASLRSLSFEKPDIKKFRNLALAFEAMEKGGNMPCILNAANEIAVEAFLKKQLGFLQIPSLIEKCMETLPFVRHPDLDAYVETDRLCRIKAKDFIKNS